MQFVIRALGLVLASLLFLASVHAAEKRTGVGDVPRKTKGMGVAQATTSIKCGNTIYEVSSGTAGGFCSTSRPENGPTNQADCADGGNKAQASCSKGCGASQGAGSCTIKSAN